MADDDRRGERHSRALSPELITDPEEKARREAANGLRQFDVAMEILEEWRARGAKFRLRMPTVLTLHRTALEGISAFAGNFRPAGVEIEGSKHEPVGAHQVPDLVQDMCDYVNENWDTKTAIHLAAYVMWRLNWIHPFDDGNGRTSRTLSYLVLCAHLGSRLPGSKTIPDQISENKAPYYKALEAADAAWQENRIDLSALETLLEDLLAIQLINIMEQAKGGPLSE